jgi:molybdenum cofactor cytidylyltransferase
MKLSLPEALRANSSQFIALIGAGGKTTTMFQLARQLPDPVILTATSHLGIWQLAQADHHIIATASTVQTEIARHRQGVILVTGDVDGDRTKPVAPNILDELKQYGETHSVPLLIEADGARQKPLKAWAEHEPPIPPFVDLVIHVVGLRGIGQPLDGQTVHRPEIFAKLGQIEMGQIISPSALTRVLMHPEGAGRNIPVQARRLLLFNQADTPELQSMARSMAAELLSSYHAVVIASLQQSTVLAVHEPVAGIILAAGASTRYGQPKQLLDWKGEPFVRVVAKTALQAGLSPVVMVTGAQAQEIQAAVENLGLTVKYNQEWASGQASSIRAGIEALEALSPFRAGAGIFLLADQPQLTTSVLRALVEKHAEGLYPVLAPMVMDQRANPVLFDRVTFSDLKALQGDVGGRAIFHKYPVEYLPWHDDRLLLDVDTPEMYRRLLSDENL